VDKLFYNYFFKTIYKSNHELLFHDKRILRKIILIIIIGVLLEVGFAILTAIVYSTTVL